MNEIDTKKFKTRTLFIERNNRKIPGIWTIALDVGYSSTKCFSPNFCGVFPTYARKKDAGEHMTIGGYSVDYICYKDLETGEEWLVGEAAANIIEYGDMTDIRKSVVNRDRYFDPAFKVYLETGLGLSMRENAYGDPSGKVVHVQTGLPPEYMKKDTPYIQRPLSGRHHFSLKIGNAAPIEFDFTIEPSHVYVMPQPMGTLLGAAIDNSFHPTADGMNILSSNTIVFDPGFGTLDIFTVKRNEVQQPLTDLNLGMAEVFCRTIHAIYEKYGIEVSLPSLQNYLAEGEVPYYNRESFESYTVPFADLLEKANEEVCMEALKKLNSLFNLVEYKYLIITGGTGAAWNKILRDKMKGLRTLTILDGNLNDDLPFLFSNVRGYYISRCQNFEQLTKKTG